MKTELYATMQNLLESMEKFQEAAKGWPKLGYINFDNLYEENILPYFSMQLLREYLRQPDCCIEGVSAYTDSFVAFYKKTDGAAGIDKISGQETEAFWVHIKNMLDEFLEKNVLLLELISDYWLSSQFQVRDQGNVKPVMQWLEKGGEICLDNGLKLPPGKIYAGLAEHFAFLSNQRSLYSSAAVKEEKALSQICALLCLLHKKSILSSSEYENYVYGLTVPTTVYTKDIEKGVRADNPDPNRLNSGKIITMVAGNVPYVSSKAIWEKCKKHFPIHLLGKHIVMLCKNTLIMNHSFDFPSQNLMLAANQIIVQKDSYINVSGKNGVSASSNPKPTKEEKIGELQTGTAGEAGESGGNATISGNIFLLAGTILTLGNQFKLRANGGNGGNGQPGGVGAQGGMGRRGTNLVFDKVCLQDFITEYGTFPLKIQYWAGEPGTKGGRGGSGGRGGDGGRGGKAGCVQTFCLAGNAAIEAVDGKYGEVGTGGAGGPGGYNGLCAAPHILGLGWDNKPTNSNLMILRNYNKSNMVTNSLHESLQLDNIDSIKHLPLGIKGTDGSNGTVNSTLLDCAPRFRNALFYKEVVDFLFLNSRMLNSSRKKAVARQDAYPVTALQFAPADTWFECLCVLSEFEQEHLISLFRTENELLSHPSHTQKGQALKQKRVAHQNALGILCELYGFAEQSLTNSQKQLRENDRRMLSQMLHLKIVNLKSSIAGRQGLAHRVVNLEALNETIGKKINASDHLQAEAWNRLSMESYEAALDIRIQTGKEDLYMLADNLKTYMKNATKSFEEAFDSVMLESADMADKKNELELQKKDMEANYSKAMVGYIFQTLLSYAGAGVDFYNVGKSAYDANNNRLKDLSNAQNALIDFKSRTMLQNRQFALDERDFYIEFRENLIQKDDEAWQTLGTKLKTEYGAGQKVEIPEAKIDELIRLEKDYLTHPENGKDNYSALIRLYDEYPELKAPAADIGKSHSSYIENQKLTEDTDTLKEKISKLENGKSDAIAAAVAKNFFTVIKGGVQIYQFINSCIKFSDNYKKEIDILEKCIETTKTTIQLLNIFGDEILSFQQDGVSQPLEDWLNRDRDNIDIVTVYKDALKFKEKLNKIKKFIVQISENDMLSNIINTIEIRSFLEDMKNYLDTELAITERISDMEDKQSDVKLLKNILQANKLGWSNEKIACVNSFIISELQYMINLQYQYAGMLTFPLWIDRKHELDISGYQLSIGNEDGKPLTSAEKSAELLQSISMENKRIEEWLCTERQYITPQDGVCVSKNFINEDYFARISFDNAKDLLFSFVTGEEIIVQLEPKWLNRPRQGLSAVKFGAIYAYIDALQNSEKSRKQSIQFQMFDDAFYYLITDGGRNVSKYRFPQAPVSVFHSMSMSVSNQFGNCVICAFENQVNKKQGKCISNSPYTKVKISIKNENGFSIRKKFEWDKISDKTAKNLYQIFPEIREKGIDFETYFKNDLLDAKWLQTSNDERVIPMRWSQLSGSELGPKYMLQQQQALKEMLLEQMLICSKEKLDDFHIDFIGYGTYQCSDDNAVKGWNLPRYEAFLCDVN